MERPRAIDEPVIASRGRRLPVMWLAFQSDADTLQINDVVNRIAPRLQTVSGVADVPFTASARRRHARGSTPSA